MYASKNFLDCCLRLHELGWHSGFELGARLGRAYADVGIEEFFQIGPYRLVSLYSGKIAEVSEPQLQHFFAVPSSVVLVNEVLKSGFDITEVKFLDQRSWQVRVQSPSAGVVIAQHAEFDCAMAEVLMKILTKRGPNEHV